jgi:hypothetical protein
MARLGGEYFDPRDADAEPVRVGRIVFLSRIERVAPEVLRTLHDEVLPVYRAERAREAPNGVADSPGLADTLDGWARQWHLTDDWLMQDALHTMDWWVRAPQSTARLQWHPDGWGSMVHEPEPLTLSWQPTLIRWDEFERHAREAMSRYRAEVDAWARERGLERAPEKNAPRRSRDPGAHFEWLIRYQVQGWTHAKIAQHYARAYDAAKRSSPTVSRALHETAALIGLTLRVD